MAGILVVSSTVNFIGGVAGGVPVGIAFGVGYGKVISWIGSVERIKVLLAGSHTLDEVQYWSSYLINFQVVHIRYLKEIEAYQLIERPAKDFSLHYDFESSHRVVELTRGHPFLIQLLCSEIVEYKNEQDPAIRRQVRLADVEAVVPEALRRGRLFFADISCNQVDSTGQAMLQFLAAQGSEAIVPHDMLARHFPEQPEQSLTTLFRRELIEWVDRGHESGYRFQVELIRRWFAQPLSYTP